MKFNISKCVKKLAILIVNLMVVLIISSCNDVSTVPSNNTIRTNIYVEGYYGIRLKEYEWERENDIKGLEQEWVGYKYKDSYYVKLDNAIYKIDQNQKKMCFENSDEIKSIVSVVDNGILFDSKDKNSSGLRECVLNVYYFDSQRIEEVTKTDENIYLKITSYVDDEDLILNQNGPDDSLEVLSLESNSYDLTRYNSIYDLPENFYIENVPNRNQDTDVIVYKNDSNNYRYNTGLTKWVKTFSSGYLDLKYTYSKHMHYGARYKQAQYNGVLIMTQVENNADYDRTGIAVSASHCDSNVWEKDILEKYDFKTNTANDFYEDAQNRILGYNYDENIVYLYSFNKNEIEAKDLDDYSITVLTSLELAKTIKFTWCDTTLFWIYENDGVETYGGYLEL